MECPICNVDLESSNYRGICVEKCPSCEGIWLDIDELDQLEDKAFDLDELKGNVIFSSSPTNLQCPKCGSDLKRFKYRLHDLQLEFCEKQHGYWLDKEEERKIIKLMNERKMDMQRKHKAEQEWDEFLEDLKSPNFFQKLKTLLS
jgi:Zn-finger nucleic acid-binding protein